MKSIGFANPKLKYNIYICKKKKKQITTPYYKNNIIETLTSKTIIAITVKIIKIIKLSREKKNSKILTNK